MRNVFNHAKKIYIFDVTIYLNRDVKNTLLFLPTFILNSLNILHCTFFDIYLQTIVFVQSKRKRLIKK